MLLDLKGCAGSDELHLAVSNTKPNHYIKDIILILAAFTLLRQTRVCTDASATAIINVQKQHVAQVLHVKMDPCVR
jgi:hypothetical protein